MQLVLIDNFSKRHNSTLVPDITQITYRTLNISLKNIEENSTLLHPTFIINWKNSQGQDNVKLGTNYIGFEGRYYFVDDIIFISNNLVKLVCSMDVLATYKTQIGNSVQYIERSASAVTGETENYIIDNAVSVGQWKNYKANATTNFSGVVTGWSVAGCYVVRVISKTYSSNNASGVASYVMDTANFANLLDFIFDESNFIDELTDEVVKTFFNPFQYIVSVRWYPFTVGTISTGSALTVKLGWWNPTGVTAYALANSGGVSFGSYLTIPSFPYNDWRCFDPRVTSIKLYLPSVGTIDVAPMDINLNGNLYFNYYVDTVSGEAIVRLYGDELIATYSINFGADIQLGQMRTDWAQAIGSGVSAISSAIGGNIGGAITNAIDAVQNVTMPTPSLNGSQGNVAMLKYQSYAEIVIETFITSENAQALLGKPRCYNHQIKDFSGYVKCAGASISVDGPISIRDEINSYLNGGFYYE